MANKKPKPITPTTMRLPDDMKKRLAKQAVKQDRTSSYLAKRYIEQGLARDEKKHGGKAVTGALD